MKRVQKTAGNDNSALIIDLAIEKVCDYCSINEAELHNDCERGSPGAKAKQMLSALLKDELHISPSLFKNRLAKKPKNTGFIYSHATSAKNLNHDDTEALLRMRDEITNTFPSGFKKQRTSKIKPPAQPAPLPHSATNAAATSKEPVLREIAIAVLLLSGIKIGAVAHAFGITVEEVYSAHGHVDLKLGSEIDPLRSALRDAARSWTS